MQQTLNDTVRRAATRSQDAAEAAAQLHAQLDRGGAAVVVSFASPSLDRAAFAATLQERFGATPVVGCTTAGQVDGAGYRDEGAVAFALGGSDFAVAQRVLPELDSFTTGEAAQVVAELREDLGERGRVDRELFALLLIDGLSMQEERVTYALQTALGDIGLVGGSAGDGLDFGATAVFAGGQAHTNAAVLVLVHCARPFELVKTQHFTATETKLVVTGADTDARRVTEINGMPAAEEYARLIGTTVDALTPPVFARYPLMVRMVGQWYVRSIQKVNDDGSLTIYCAIDEGVVLTLGQGISMVENLDEMLAEVRASIGTPALVVGCDCILRRLEAEATGIGDALARLFEAHHVVGFSTYGEQFGAVHVNQTFTGIAIAAQR